MLGALRASVFLADYFEKKPWFGVDDAAMDLGVEDILRMLPDALVAGNLRVIHQRLGPEGLAPGDLLTLLGGAATNEAFQRLFQAGEYSFAMQNTERYFPSVANIASALGQLWGMRVEVTAFLSPAGKENAATRPHYDRSEVLVQQLVGEKTWDIYAPLDPLPNSRSASLPVDISTVCRLESYRLVRGSCLYLPRGFIHNVYNDGSGPSLHLSYVGMVDSWTSLFGNLLDVVYAELRDRPTWRRRIERDELSPEVADTVLGTMLEEFGTALLSKARHLPGRFLDHCLNDGNQHDRMNDGRSSIALLDAEDSQIHVVMNGAHYLERHSEEPGKINVSSDGQRFYPVSKHVLSALQSGARTIDALCAMDLCEEDELLRTLSVITHEIGIASLRRTTSEPH